MERELMTIAQIIDKLSRFQNWFETYNNESHESYSNGYVSGRIGLVLELLNERDEEWKREFQNWQRLGEPIDVDY